MLYLYGKLYHNKIYLYYRKKQEFIQTVGVCRADSAPAPCIFYVLIIIVLGAMRPQTLHLYIKYFFFLPPAGLPDGVAAWLAAINGSAELTYVNPFALCRQSALPSKVPQNRYSALRSHIKSKAQPKRVNSVLRTSNNTRLVTVSLTLMAHYVESTKIKSFDVTTFTKFAGVNNRLVSVNETTVSGFWQE